MNFNLVSTTII